MTKNNNIPDGWEVKKILELGKVVTGSTPPMSDKSNYNGNFSWITAQDFRAKYIYDSMIKLSNKGKKLSRIIPAGSVLVTCIASIGLNAIAGVNMATNQQINSIIPNENTNGEFLYYLIDNNANYLKIFAGAGGMLILSKSEFEKMKFAVPPLSEQKKIAEILSGWDKVIELLDRKIDLKSQQKKYLMQTLLTGDIRLSGFILPWIEIKLGDIGIISSAGVDKKIIEGEKLVKLLNYLDVYKKDFIYSSDVAQIVSASDYKIKSCDVKKGDIFFTPSSETPDDIGISAVIMEDILNTVYSYHIVRLRPNININSLFISFVLNRDDFYKQVQKVAEGSGQRYVISLGEFRDFIINIPTDLKEQEKIAEILTLADDEISLLKKKRELIKQQKKYLMQTLLTGQIRVSV